MNVYMIKRCKELSFQDWTNELEQGHNHWPSNEAELSPLEPTALTDTVTSYYQGHRPLASKPQADGPPKKKKAVFWWSSNRLWGLQGKPSGVPGFPFLVDGDEALPCSSHLKKNQLHQIITNSRAIRRPETSTKDIVEMPNSGRRGWEL